LISESHLNIKFLKLAVKHKTGYINTHKHGKPLSNDNAAWFNSETISLLPCYAGLLLFVANDCQCELS